MQHKPHIICEAHLGETFGRAIMATIRTQPETYLDFLFDRDGEPMPLQSDLAKIIATFFNKKFEQYVGNI